MKSAKGVKNILLCTVKLNDYRLLLLMKQELFELLCM